MKKILTISLLLLFLFTTGFAQHPIELTNWKFSTGDNFAWAKPNFDDSKWKTIQVGYSWESQGYDGYNGFTWYRVKFTLPENLNNKNHLRDTLQILLGKIEECDRTYLNGELLGQNGNYIPANNYLFDNQDTKARDITRNYSILLNDPRLFWGKENVLAVRVFDSEGNGGICSLPVIRVKTASQSTKPVNVSKTVQTKESPYILTPAPAATPQINGASVVGVKPGSPFLFRIPTTGLRPMIFSAEKLPEGLTLNSKTGVITGSIKQAGEYRVKLKASNKKGNASRNLKIVVGNRISLTPPMGWNSYWACHPGVTEKEMRQAIDAFIQSGLADHGWTYINMDEGWNSFERNATGQMIPNETFGSMKALTDYIHSFGLKAGIYSSPGPVQCNDGYTGSYQHEETDAQTFADWGFDFLKYDWCSYGGIAKDQSLAELQKPYKIMKAALDKTGRDIAFSFCQYGMGKVWEWGDSIGGNMWRNGGDLTDSWGHVKGVGFNREEYAQWQKPGNWNDPDLLQVGTLWAGSEYYLRLQPTHLSPNEQYTHISLWSLLAAPLLLSCDLTKLDDFTLNLLTNDEVIAIDQDPLGKQGTAVLKDASYQVIVKDLEDGSKAVGLFNFTESDMKISVTWEVLKINGKQTVRDVWRQKDIGVFSDKFESVVPPHGVVLVKISN